MSRGRGLILLALFVSGMAGLMHEVVWAKFLIDLTGNTARSNAVVLTVFMAGLAIGAVLFGKRVDRWKNPLRTYAWLELAIGAYCLLLPLLVRLAGAAYEAAAARFFEETTLKLFLRFLLSVSVVSAPAILMGATLPILAKHLVSDVAQTRREVAGLYAANNIGAVFGSGLAGFVTLPLLGILPSLVLASFANFAAAAMVWLLSRRTAAPIRPSPSSDPPAAEVADSGRLYGNAQLLATRIALFLAGFAAMGYEVVLLRVIALAFGSSTYSFTVMLMCFITGIGLGSAVLTGIEVRRPLWLLGASQLAVVASFALVAPWMERLPYWLGLMRVDLQGAALGFELYELSKALLCLLIFFVPTLCIGIGFPLVAHVQARSVSSIGGTVGSTYAWNTFGNVLGVLVTSLILIPWVGIGRSFEVNLLFSLVSALSILAVAYECRPRLRLAATALALAALALYAVQFREWPKTINLAADHLRLREGPPPGWTSAQRSSHPTASFQAWKLNYVQDLASFRRYYFEEDENNTVLAFEVEEGVELFVNGKGDASTYPGDLINQVVLGHVPLFINLDAKTAMVIGHGSGITAGSAMLHGLEHLDIVEISEGVMGADYLFEAHNNRVLSQPQVEVTIDDARTFLRTVPRRYDVIISVPSNPWIAGIGSLFTVEFFTDARERLNPGGLLCMWFHQYEQSDAACELVLRTLGSVFEHAVVFHSFGSDVLAIASADPIEPDFARMEARFEEPAILSDYFRIGITNLAALLAHHAISPSRFQAIVGKGPLNTDSHQRLQYAAPRDHFANTTATLVSTFEGFHSLPGGGTDGWLDRYLDYRSEQGQPVSAEELAHARSVLAFNLRGDEHRLVRHVASRAAAAPSRPVPCQGPARGGLPELEALPFAQCFGRARVYMTFGPRPSALPLYERALALSPGHKDISLELAELLAELNRPADAAAILAPVAARHPGENALHYKLADLYVAAGDVASAASVLEALLKRGEDALALERLGDARALLGETEAARGSFERSLARDPSRWQVSIKLARMLAEEPGGRQEALAVLAHAIERYPRNRELVELRDTLTALERP
jgi:predicted membrane-bound spermidine synthase